MTHMHERFENSGLVEAWLKEPTFLKPVDEGRVAAMVHQTPQVGRWPPRVDLGRFAPMFDATKFVAASVILALTGGLLLNAMPTDPNTSGLVPATQPATEAASEAPTAEASNEAPPEQRLTVDADMPFIVLPDELPDGVDRGTIDTPAGPARWVRLSGARGSLPRSWSQLLPWNDGILAWTGYFGQLVTTGDGANWTTIDVERGLLDGMVRMGNELFLVDVHGGRVLTTTDPTGDWRGLDASALAAAKLPGWKVDQPRAVSRPMAIDGRVVFVAEYRYSLPKEQLGISRSGTKNLRALPDGRYVLCSSGDKADCSADARWVLRMKETPQGLVVRHDRSGQRLGLIEGATADQIYTAEHGRYRRLFAIEGEAVVEIDSPWPGISPWQVANRVVAPGGAEPVLRQWHSSGRAEPSTAGLPSIASDLPRGRSLYVDRFPDRLAARVHDQRDHIVGAWVSSDGVDWTPAPGGAPDGADVRWSGAGWLASRTRGRASEHWLHIGGSWVPLESMGLEGEGPPLGIGNTLLLPSQAGDTEVLWVLTLPQTE